MSLPGIEPGGSPQGFLNKLVNTFKKVGNWLGRRKVYEVHPPQRQTPQPLSDIHRRSARTDLLSRRASATPQQNHASLKPVLSQVAILQKVLVQIESTQAGTSHALSRSPVTEQDIHAARNACNEQKRQLEALLQALKSDISKTGDGSPVSIMAVALEKVNQVEQTILDLKDRAEILAQRLMNNPASPYHLLKAQQGHYRAATDAVLKTLEKPGVAHRDRLEVLLNQLLDKQEEPGKQN